CGAGLRARVGTLPDAARDERRGVRPAGRAQLAGAAAAGAQASRRVPGARGTAAGPRHPRIREPTASSRHPGPVRGTRPDEPNVARYSDGPGRDLSVPEEPAALVPS